VSRSEVKAFRDDVLDCGCGREVLCCPLKSDVLVCGSHSEVVHKCPFCVCVFSSFLRARSRFISFIENEQLEA
jgi:hypothetical protein